NPHIQQTGRNITDTREGRARQVDNPPANEWSPVIDAHHHALAVAHVRHLHLGAKGQGAVGCGLSARLVELAAGSLSVLESVRIVRGLSGFAVAAPLAVGAGLGSSAAGGKYRKQHK